MTGTHATGDRHDLQHSYPVASACNAAEVARWSIIGVTHASPMQALYPPSGLFAFWSPIPTPQYLKHKQNSLSCLPAHRFMLGCASIKGPINE